jgi:hypothetical protein
MIATYRLAQHSASFEFYNWLVMVKAAGATKIIFDIANPKIRKFSRESVMQRFYSIIEPGPILAGLKSRYGNDQGLNVIASQIFAWIRAGNKFTRLVSVKPPIECKYTVTLRNNHNAKARNSNAETWRAFAEEIGAIVIEDYFDKPIHLHDRMALYAGAQMNFGVCNGPMHLLSLTTYPVMIIANTQSARNNVMRWGVLEGGDLPWMLPNQKMIWCDDNLDNLRRMMDGRSSLSAGQS